MNRKHIVMSGGVYLGLIFWMKSSNITLCISVQFIGINVPGRLKAL